MQVEYNIQFVCKKYKCLPLKYKKIMYPESIVQSEWGKWKRKGLKESNKHRVIKTGQKANDFEP